MAAAGAAPEAPAPSPRNGPFSSHAVQKVNSRVRAGGRARATNESVVGKSGGVDRTPDGRYIVIDGRRWRATDPALPEAFHSELVHELSSARRAVRAKELDARARVQAAKVALGERGPKWWDAPTPETRRVRLEAAVLALTRSRAPDRTICPSDAARAVCGEGWRNALDDARTVIRTLAADGHVDVLQKGVRVDPVAPWRGPIRVRWRSDT
ncbi:MAG: hypothetical protein NVS3B12_29250 [Acidimicrobiales bacterium]